MLMRQDARRAWGQGFGLAAELRLGVPLPWPCFHRLAHKEAPAIRATCPESDVLVCRGFLGTVDYKNFDRASASFKPQPELFLKRSENGRSRGIAACPQSVVSTRREKVGPVAVNSRSNSR